MFKKVYVFGALLAHGAWHDVNDCFGSFGCGCVDRVLCKFSDANGPITDLPASASKVTASVTVSNNSASASSVVLWVGKYVDEVLTDIKSQKQRLPLARRIRR